MPSVFKIIAVMVTPTAHKWYRDVVFSLNLGNLQANHSLDIGVTLRKLQISSVLEEKWNLDPDYID